MKTNRFFGLLRHGLWLAAFAAGGAAQAQSVAAHEALKALLGKAATQPAAAASGANPVAAATAPTMVPPAVAGSYRVRRGDTLDNIIRRVLPGVRPTRALRNAFVQANPQAFVRNSPHYLRAGAVLQVPGAAGAASAMAGAVATDAQARRQWVRFPR